MSVAASQRDGDERVTGSVVLNVSVRLNLEGAVSISDMSGRQPPTHFALHNIRKENHTSMKATELVNAMSFAISDADTLNQLRI